MEKQILTRKELYDLIWAGPMSLITRKYDITYPQLKRICFDLSVPIPENGHWTKIRFGKQVNIKSLPSNYSGEDEIELIERDFYNVSPDTLSDNRANNECKRDELFRVPDKLVNPDFLILNTKNYFDAVKRYDWRSHESYPIRKDVLNIDVRHQNLPRALRIMNYLIKILRDRNHDVIIKYEKTFAVMSGENIEIRLRERNKVIDEPRDKFSTRRLESTGMFSFIIGDYRRKEVNDGHDLLETKLEVILEKLEKEGEREKEERIASEEWNKKWKEQQRLEQEKRDRKKNELSEFKQIYIDANRMHQSEIMRNYVSILENNAAMNGMMSDDLKNWIDWVKKKVDWYDPLINKIDDTFDDNDRMIIFRDLIKD
jgi:hypothetical protein